MDTLSSSHGFRLDDSFLFWLGRASHELQESFNRSLSESDVTWPQWMVMNVLYHQIAQTPAQVADYLGIDRSAVTRLADRLAKKGLLERKQDGVDRRCVQLCLTPRGNRIIFTLNQHADEHQKQLNVSLGQDNVSALSGHVRILLKQLGVTPH